MPILEMTWRMQIAAIDHSDEHNAMLRILQNEQGAFLDNVEIAMESSHTAKDSKIDLAALKKNVMLTKIAAKILMEKEWLAKNSEKLGLI
ncbi:MAG: hypothetical protein Q9N67_03795 [Ghiorsea sp.]|nr:hypothetical protein [Ghiorsea sp.]